LRFGGVLGAAQAAMSVELGLLVFGQIGASNQQALILVNAFRCRQRHCFDALGGKSRKLRDLAGYVPICAGGVPVLTTNERCLLDVSNEPPA